MAKGHRLCTHGCLVCGFLLIPLLPVLMTGCKTWPHTQIGLCACIVKRKHTLQMRNRRNTTRGIREAFTSSAKNPIHAVTRHGRHDSLMAGDACMFASRSHVVFDDGNNMIARNFCCFCDDRANNMRDTNPNFSSLAFIRSSSRRSDMESSSSTYVFTINFSTPLRLPETIREASVRFMGRKEIK